MTAKQDIRGKLLQAAETMVRESATPGAGVALLADGEALLDGGIGYRDVERLTGLGADAQFYIYSVTKSLIAVAILQLAEQGRLMLDAPVRNYLPETPSPFTATVRQLLNHTGGLPDYGGMGAYFDALKATPREPWSDEEFLARTLSRGLLFEPGQGWSYSNIGYLLLRRLIELLTGGSFREALRAQIFEPLGLRDTFVAESLIDAEGLTPGYTTLFGGDGTQRDIRSTYHPGWVSHGVVVSTPRELATIYEALFGGRLLARASLEAMLEPAPVGVNHPFFRQPAYGLGVMIDAASPYGVVAGHGGGGPGYAACALHCSDVANHRVTVVVLANADQPDLAFPLAFRLVEMLAEALHVR